MYSIKINNHLFIILKPYVCVNNIFSVISIIIKTKCALCIQDFIYVSLIYYCHYCVSFIINFYHCILLPVLVVATLDCLLPLSISISLPFMAAFSLSSYSWIFSRFSWHSLYSCAFSCSDSAQDAFACMSYCSVIISFSSKLAT